MQPSNFYNKEPVNQIFSHFLGSSLAKKNYSNFSKNKPVELWPFTSISATTLFTLINKWKSSFLNCSVWEVYKITATAVHRVKENHYILWVVLFKVLGKCTRNIHQPVILKVVFYDVHWRIMFTFTNGRQLVWELFVILKENSYP